MEVLGLKCAATASQSTKSIRIVSSQENEPDQRVIVRLYFPPASPNPPKIARGPSSGPRASATRRTLQPPKFSPPPHVTSPSAITSPRFQLHPGQPRMGPGKLYPGRFHEVYPGYNVALSTRRFVDSVFSQRDRGGTHAARTAQRTVAFNVGCAKGGPGGAG